MNISRWMAWLLGVALLAFGPGWAVAQSEPTVDQIYQAANSGRLDEAVAMTDQVLKNHPNSGKAHYVKAELAARQGNGSVARQELVTAEKLAPGLPFARAESVRALQNQVARLGGAPAQGSGTQQMGGSASPRPASPAPAMPSLPWGTLLIGAAVVIGIMALLRRRRAAAAATYGGGPAAPGSNTSMMGGGYGPGPAGAPGTGPNPYGAPGAGPYPYGAPGAAPSMGSTLGRGLATGLAIGAGAVAAQEIGRRMFDQHGNPIAAPDAGHGPGQAGNFGLSDPSSIDNPDMGGQDFGINDAGSWDDGGAGGDVGGGDWDT